MPRYLVTHSLAEDYAGQSSDDVEKLRHQLHDCLRGTRVQWMRGWWLYAAAQQLCEYEAPDEDAIRRVIRESGMASFMPIAAVQEAMPNGPSDVPGEFE